VSYRPDVRHRVKRPEKMGGGCTKQGNDKGGMDGNGYIEGRTLKGGKEGTTYQ